MIIGGGIFIGPGITIKNDAIPGIITNGLIMNLAVAPSTAIVGTTWTDISGNGNNGTLAGTNTYLSYTAAHGGGIVVTGSESGTYISTGYNLSSSTFTVSMAASFNPTTYWATLWGNEYYSGSQGYYAYMPGATSLNVGSAGSPANFVVPSNLGATLAIWDFVISGTSVTVYKNGVSTYTGTTTVPTFATDGLYFGSRHANGGGNTNTDNCAGTYYSMRVYNVALNSTQIAQNYSALKGTYGLS